MQVKVVVGQSSRSYGGYLLSFSVLLGSVTVIESLVVLSAQNQYALRFDDPTWQRYVNCLKPLVSDSCVICSCLGHRSQCSNKDGLMFRSTLQS